MRRVVVVLAGVLCGCPLEVLPDGGACPLELRFGTESVSGEFTTLGDGSEVRVIAGPQGGWHVWVSAQVTGAPRAGTLSYSLISGGAVVAGPLRLPLGKALLNGIDCGWERRSDALVFFGNGEAFRGAMGQLQATLESPGASPFERSALVELK